MSFFSFVKTIFKRPGCKPETMDYENAVSMNTPSPTKKNNDFDRAFDFIMRWEGGVSNDKADRGGLTKFGISEKSHPGVNILGLTQQDAHDIYLYEYWRGAGCDKMSWPSSLIIFDLAVNSGVDVAKLAAKTYGENPDKLIKYRRDRYEKIVQKNPIQKKFLNGWMNRINDLQKVCGL